MLPVRVKRAVDTCIYRAKLNHSPANETFILAMARVPVSLDNAVWCVIVSDMCAAVEWVFF